MNAELQGGNLPEKKLLRVHLGTLLLVAVLVVPVAYLGIQGKLSRKLNPSPVVERIPALGELVHQANVNPSFNNYFLLARGYGARKLYPEAIEAYKKAIELNPTDAVAYNNLGATYGELGRWDELIAACRKALELQPNFQLARNNIAWAEQQKLQK